MADNEAASHEREQSLDFLSANFDPLQALYTKDLKPPIPSIQVFNNLGEYARVIKEGKPKTVPQKDPRKIARLRRAASRRTRNLKPEYKPPDISTRLKEIASNRVAREDLLSSERRGSISGQDGDGLSRDKKENALGFGRGRSGKKKYMNVLEKMDACATGPLSILYKCLDKRYKVQVWIRKYKGLRSVLTGYVIAFDKHMNLALMDVDEVYTTEENHRQERCTEEEKTTKKKKKKKKKRKTKSHKNQIKENLMDTDKKENFSVGFTPLCDKINVKTVPELKENPIPLANESTTAQDIGTGLTTVGDLNRPFKSLKSDYNRHQTVSKSSEGTKELTIMKDGETSSSLVTTKDCAKTGMLSADQLAALSRQWADEQEQESKEALDSQQQIQTIDNTEPPMDLDSEQTGYLFSHDLKVRVPAHEDMESQDVEFTVVGIFQPASAMESNEKSATLPENLEINVPLSLSDTIDKNEEMKDRTIELDKPVKPVITELSSHGAGNDGELKDHCLQVDNPVLPVSEPVLQCIDIEGDSKDQVMELDKPEVPVSEPVLHSINIDGDSQGQVMELDKPEVPVSEPVLHNKDEGAKDKVIHSDNVVTPTAESILNVIELDGNTAQNDEIFAAETCFTDGKSVICEGSSKEGESLRVCDFSDDIENPSIESFPAVSCANDENSIICKGNSKEREISRDFSTLNPENPIIESFTAVSCVSEEKKIGERLLEKLDVQVESEGDKPTYLREGPRSTEQNENEGNLKEDEDVKKTKEKCSTYEEKKNSWNDNKNKYKEESENIGKMNQGIECCEEEGSEVEGKDFPPASELGSITSSKEQSVSVDNKLTVLSRNEDSAVTESGAQDKPCENVVVESTKGQKESWKQESLSRERKTLADSEDKDMENNIGCVVAEPGGEDHPCKDKDADFHKELEESSPCESLTSVKKNDAVADPGEGDDPDGLEADLEESSPCESLSSVKNDNAVADSETRDDRNGLPTKPDESITGEPIQEYKSEDSRSNLGGEDKEIEETEKSTQSNEGTTREGVAEGQQAEGEYDMKEKDDDKAMESEKEEGEITSSDDEEPAENTLPQVDQPKHSGTKNDQPKKLSVWERLGFKDKARKEESASSGGGDNYEKKRRDKKRQDTRRSTSGEHKRKEESGRKKEEKQRKDMKTGERRGSVGSEKESRRDKDAGIKRRERLSTRAEDRESVRSDLQLRKDKEKKDERKKTEHRVVTSGHVVKDDAEKPSHDAVSSTNQPRKQMDGKMDGKTRERRPSSREEKEGQRKEGRGASRVIARDEAETQRSKKEKRRGESEKGPKLSSTEIKKNQAKQMGSSSDVKKQARNKEKKSDEVKEPRLSKNEVKKEERKEKTVQPQGDCHSESRSKNDTRYGMKARGESVDRKEKKEATSLRKPGEPQGDQTKTRSSNAKQLVLKEVSSNQKKPKEIIKEKPEKGVHRLTEQEKHRQPKGKVSHVKPKISDQPQGTQPRERRKEDRLPDTKVNKTQETQSEKSSSRVGSELSRKEDQESGKRSEATKQIGANRLGTTERNTISQRSSACKTLAENLTSLENPKTEKTDVKQVKVGLLPTPVLEMKTRRSGTERLTGNIQRKIDASTVRARNTSSESSKMKRNENRGKKSLETLKRKRSTEYGGGSVKRLKRTEISEKNSPKPTNPREQFKYTTRKKDKSDSEPEVKTTRETTGSDSRSSTKDMGGEGRKAICTARRIEVGKGKLLEFKRRHVNQLFVRGDNIVMIGYAT